MTQGIHLHLFASAVGVRSLQCRQCSTNKARARSLGIALIRLIQDKPSRPPWVSESLKLERKLQRRRRTSIEPIERENGKRSQSTLGIFDALRYSSGEHPSSWHSHHCNGRLRITVPRGCRVGDSCRCPFSRPEAGLIASARCCFSLARRNSPANGCSGLDLTLSAATTDLAVQIQQLAQHLGVHPPPPPPSSLACFIATELGQTSAQRNGPTACSLLRRSLASRFTRATIWSSRWATPSALDLSANASCPFDRPTQVATGYACCFINVTCRSKRFPHPIAEDRAEWAVSRNSVRGEGGERD